MTRRGRAGRGVSHARPSSRGRTGKLVGNFLARRFSRGPAPAAVVIGLGNPGKEYENTRHNAGFWYMDRLASELSVKFQRRNPHALTGEGNVDGLRVALAKPRTYVNLSGQAATYLLARYRLPPSSLLVVYDDIALPPGKLRLRPSGSAGGHNGIKSIIAALGTQDFPRLRIGVGNAVRGADRVSHVLGRLPRSDRAAVDDALERGLELLPCLLTEGIETAMNRFN